MNRNIFLRMTYHEAHYTKDYGWRKETSVSLLQNLQNNEPRIWSAEPLDLGIKWRTLTL
jgi:hypothetical protein